MSTPEPRQHAATIAAAVRSGRQKATDVVARHLEAATASQQTLNAFTQILETGAMEAAAAVDASVAAGNDPGPLAGVPIAVKDLIDQAGIDTTNGSSFPSAPATETAPAVARLTAAGAVVIGRTGLHEFAFGFSSENHWSGPVHNPWDTTTSPGGSSGGSGAAVGAGLLPIALGTDTGGSIRVPAALCGVVGLKVTHGRVPLRGVTPLAPSFDTVGPIGGSVGDTALAYRVMAGFDALDPWSLPVEVTPPGPPPSLASLRLGVPHPWVDRPLADPVAAGWAWFADAARQAGATLVELDLPDIDFPGLVTEAMYPEVAAVHRNRFTDNPDGYGPEVRERVAAALDADMDGYLAGLAWRTRMRNAATTALTTCDALVTPSVAALHKTIGVDTISIDGEAASYRVALSCFSALVNQMGLPALSAPLALTGTPPPSIQLIGGPWQEHRLLELGSGLTKAGILAVPPPPGATKTT